MPSNEQVAASKSGSTASQIVMRMSPGMYTEASDVNSNWFDSNFCRIPRRIVEGIHLIDACRTRS
jgi:hypothetical protein